jgi:hypothetical protein
MQRQKMSYRSLSPASAARREELTCKICSIDSDIPELVGGFPLFSKTYVLLTELPLRYQGETIHLPLRPFLLQKGSLNPI